MPDHADLPFAVPEDSRLHELEEADQAHHRDLDAQPFPADSLAIRAAHPLSAVPSLFAVRSWVTGRAANGATLTPGDRQEKNA